MPFILPSAWRATRQTILGHPAILDGAKPEIPATGAGWATACRAAKAPAVRTLAANKLTIIVDFMVSSNVVVFGLTRGAVGKRTLLPEIEITSPRPGNIDPNQLIRNPVVLNPTGSPTRLGGRPSRACRVGCLAAPAHGI